MGYPLGISFTSCAQMKVQSIDQGVIVQNDVLPWDPFRQERKCRFVVSSSLFIILLQYYFKALFLLNSTLFDFQFTSLDNVQLESVLLSVHLIVPLIRHQRTIRLLQSHFPHSSTSSSIPPLLSRRTLLSQ